MLPTKNKNTPVTSALAEAQAIVEAAEEKAKKIIDEAILSAEEIKETGYREGVRIGKDTATKNSIRLIKEHGILRSKLEEEAAKLSYKILEHIFSLKDERLLNPLKELAKKLLTSVPFGGSIDFIFHPTHTHSLDQIKTELRNLSVSTEIRFLPNEDCDPLGLVLKTDFGDIKVSLKDFLNEIARQIKMPSS